MNGIILYKSKYGSTKKYADWLSEATGFSCMETDKASVKSLSDADVIILGGGVYASGIGGLKFLRKNIGALKDKKIVVFACGASPYEEKGFQQLKEHNLKGELANLPLFYCRGAWDLDSMSFIDRKLCNLLRKMLAKKDPSEYEPWAKALMDAGDAKANWTDKKYIQPILNHIGKSI
ncbi:MAG TPA: flavodoxin domain-containing protein [Clostridia bacterium]|jgi:menaquinone-dependent protoporphyrinogen IX oxidase|nr:flavodoxin domain-containing protein [Clostridia bacterium]